MLQECARQAAEIYSKMILKTDQEGAKWKEKRIQNESKGSKREPKGSKIDLEAVLSISQESRGDVWAVWGRSWGGLGQLLARSRRLLGCSWDHPGAMLAALGGSWSGLRGVVGHIQAAWYKMPS